MDSKIGNVAEQKAELRLINGRNVAASHSFTNHVTHTVWRKIKPQATVHMNGIFLLSCLNFWLCSVANYFIMNLYTLTLIPCFAMFKQQELNMLGKTGLILFIPSDFSWVHEAQISKATYKLNTRYKNTPKRKQSEA